MFQKRKMDTYDTQVIQKAMYAQCHSKWKEMFKALETLPSIAQLHYREDSVSYLLSPISNIPCVLYLFLFCTWNVGMSLQHSVDRTVPQKALRGQGRTRQHPETEILQVGFCIFKNQVFYQCYGNLHTQKFVQVSPMEDLCMVYASPLRQISLWRTSYRDVASLSIFIQSEEKGNRNK